MTVPKRKPKIPTRKTALKPMRVSTDALDLPRSVREYGYCVWCHEPAGPYRSPLNGTPGGAERVCGVDCKKRPAGRRVESMVLR